MNLYVFQFTFPDKTVTHVNMCSDKNTHMHTVSLLRVLPLRATHAKSVRPEALPAVLSRGSVQPEEYELDPIHLG